MGPSNVRGTAALALIGVLGVAGAFNLRNYSRLRNQAQPDPYRVQDRIDRFEELQRIIPPTARVGYVSDLPRTDIREQTLYLTAAYALAPRLVVHLEKSQAGDYVVGEFAKPVDYTGFGSAQGLVLERQVGDIALYRRVRQ